MAAADRFGIYGSGFEKPSDKSQPPHIEPTGFFFFLWEKKKVFLHFLRFLCWDFFLPLPLASSVASGVDNSRVASVVPRHLPSLSFPYPLGLWPERTGHPGRKPGPAHRLAGAGDREGSQETRVTQSAFLLWETRPLFWPFASQTFFHLVVPGSGYSWLSGIQCRQTSRTSRNPEPDQEPWVGERAGVSTPEQPHAHPQPSQPPARHPAQTGQAPGWRGACPKRGTQALPEVCLHLACFAAVAHWAETEPCGVRNVNGSQVCTACLPPARPAGLHPAAPIAQGAGSPSAHPPNSPPLCLLPFSAPSGPPSSSHPPPSPRAPSAGTGGPDPPRPSPTPRPPWHPRGRLFGPLTAVQQAGGWGALAGECGVGHRLGLVRPWTQTPGPQTLQRGSSS